VTLHHSHHHHHACSASPLPGALQSLTGEALSTAYNDPSYGSTHSPQEGAQGLAAPKNEKTYTYLTYPWHSHIPTGPLHRVDSQKQAQEKIDERFRELSTAGRVPMRIIFLSFPFIMAALFWVDRMEDAYNTTHPDTEAMLRASAEVTEPTKTVASSRFHQKPIATRPAPQRPELTASEPKPWSFRHLHHRLRAC
jgi:hypothetical protein